MAANKERLTLESVMCSLHLGLLDGWNKKNNVIKTQRHCLISQHLEETGPCLNCLLIKKTHHQFGFTYFAELDENIGTILLFYSEVKVTTSTHLS